MKTHTARWFPNSANTWVLKERAQDGGAIIGYITRDERGYIYSTKHTSGRCASRYAAQRAVRRALKNT